jgi:hypothetical protein
MLGRTAVRVAVEGLTKRRTLIPFVRQALRAQPALSVRGSSRRITSMRFRPANTRVINRRDDRFDRHSRCFPLAEGKQRCKIRPPALLISGHSILEGQFGKGRDRSEIIWLQTLHFIYDRILGKPKQDVNVSGGFVHAHVRDPLLLRVAPKTAFRFVITSCAYCSFAYSALATMRMGMARSASF